MFSRMIKSTVVLLCFFGFAYSVFAQKRAMTVEDMWAMKRIGEFDISPDGKTLVFDLTEYSIEKNSSSKHLLMIPANGGEPKKMTSTGKNFNPKWRPDGSAITFLSDRNGTIQIFNLLLSGGDAAPVTDVPVDIEDFIWSTDGKNIAFVARVFPQAKSLQESAALQKEKEASPVQAVITEKLLYRHWDKWTEGKRNYIYQCDDKGENIRLLTPGDFDSPPLALGSKKDFAFSPDGKEFAFVSNRDSVVAVSTNNDIFTVMPDNIIARNFSLENKANDNYPLYSPDGKYLAYLAMERPGYESDQYKIILANRHTGEREILTDLFDRSPEEIVWSPNGKILYFNAEDEGRKRIFSLNLKSKNIQTLVQDHVNSALHISPDGKYLYFKRQAVDLPDELFRLDLKSKNLEQLSFINKPLLEQISFQPIEDFSFSSFDNRRVHGLLLKPPFFDPAKKYPLIYLIHGGPQGMWSDEFHYRWNASMFAAPGYVVAMVNFRGSTGYGQAFTDAIRKDWGGGPYKDLMTGLDYVLQNYPFIDSTRVVAAGASYGGYMINWIATHTGRFKALVTHSGAFDLTSKYGATEELWFPEWEFAGTPYENAESYEKWSPSSFVLNMKKYKTPTLVIHGQLDYRVVVTQSFQNFTALQKMGVPSKLLYFPDESHFITKPQNARLWWTEIFSWFEKWL